MTEEEDCITLQSVLTKSGNLLWEPGILLSYFQGIRDIFFSTINENLLREQFNY